MFSCDIARAVSRSSPSGSRRPDSNRGPLHYEMKGSLDPRRYSNPKPTIPLASARLGSMTGTNLRVQDPEPLAEKDRHHHKSDCRIDPPPIKRTGKNEAKQSSCSERGRNRGQNAVGTERQAVDPSCDPALPDRQRLVFTLSQVDERTPGEIAAATGMSPATVRVHLFRALRKLRGVLGEAG